MLLSVALASGVLAAGLPLNGMLMERTIPSSVSSIRGATVLSFIFTK